MRLVSVIAAIALCFSGIEARSLSAPAVPDDPAATNSVDSDHDGLTDETEEALLIQFAPIFMISWQDCADAPALFTPGRSDPTVSPEEDCDLRPGHAPRIRSRRQAVEIHYYHLWKSDCGRMSHLLDAEHVSVLAVKSPSQKIKRNGALSTGTPRLMKTRCAMPARSLGHPRSMPKIAAPRLDLRWKARFIPQ